ncbi:hypothetical protein SAMN00120144_4058 [Hymenobacter roseosalivarius DSM 11622]|uniref:Uncharacterized protein n=1 Tax=Hymenobacter roseosalivarius DSM 11622 TaxID=645990 RepID=A0A1W1V5Z7_9BACT|nr:hypothetical protein [Hymenobacter roseosalivarius]SMB88424.1 hypothetical protein SAMN00120144_4058 [Hymenobacter roseosalivarius DSM 11622]
MSISQSAAATHLGASLDILKGDIANGKTPAIGNINGWSQFLRTGDDPAYATIAADLQSLEGVINTGDAAQISSLLLTLAEHINSVVDGATPNFIDQLH